MSFDVAKWNKQRYLAEANLSDNENSSITEVEYTWKNDRELPNQEGSAIGELSDLIYDLEEYISPSIRGLAKTKTLKGLATGLAADEIRGFVSVYKDDLAGIKVFQKGNSATWAPIWKDKEPESMKGPDPRGMSLD